MDTIKEKFAYAFIDPSTLTPSEKKIWDTKDIIIKCIGGLPKCVKEIIISEILDDNIDSKTLAFWQESKGRIIIIRTLLGSESHFIATLLHEIAHAKSSAGDETRDFEDELTDLLGYLGQQIVKLADFDKKKIKKPNSSKSDFGSVNLTCKCIDCFYDEFDYNENKSYVKCKKCGREYKGGYSELVQLNREFIMENGIDRYEEELRNRIVKVLSNK